MKLKLTVDGKLYEVDVEVAEPEPPHPTYIPPAGTPRAAAPSRGASVPGAATRQPSAPEAVADENKVCRSPISGMVVRITVKVGQSIKANDTLLVLEAMKMESVITAPIAGTVSRVNVSPGDSVQRGQVLVEFE